MWVLKKKVHKRKLSKWDQNTPIKKYKYCKTQSNVSQTFIKPNLFQQYENENTAPQRFQISHLEKFFLTLFPHFPSFCLSFSLFLVISPRKFSRKQREKQCSIVVFLRIISVPKKVVTSNSSQPIHMSVLLMKIYF